MNHHLPEDAVEVARIVGAWGIKGSLRINSYSAHADALFHAKQWYLLPPEGKFKSQKITNTQESNLPLLLTVKHIKEQGKSICVDVLEVVDRNQAEALKGARVFISKASFPELEEGEFYWIDLIGLQVVNMQSESLGIVRELMSNGPQSILCVIDKVEEKPIERLIPFVDEYIVHVDLEKKLIQVDWLLDY